MTSGTAATSPRSVICLAAASRIPGSVVAAVTAHRRPGELLIGHPSGVTPVKVAAHASGDGTVAFDLLGFSRTARRLMDGTAYYPADRHRSSPSGAQAGRATFHQALQAGIDDPAQNLDTYQDQDFDDLRALSAAPLPAKADPGS